MRVGVLIVLVLKTPCVTSHWSAGALYVVGCDVKVPLVVVTSRTIANEAPMVVGVASLRVSSSQAMAMPPASAR